MKKLALAALLLAPIAGHAQNEGAVQQAFQGHTVWLKVAMPGTQLGIDIFPQRGIPMPGSYDNLLSQYPAAYRPGDSATVTKINYKKDHIEFQLDHGGFGQFGDNIDVSPVPFSPVPPSRDENDLRNRMANEYGRDREFDEHRLDHMVHDREEADRVNRQAADDATAAKISRVTAARAHGGSRFNITYDKRVPDGLTPEDIARALAPFLSFDGRGEQRDHDNQYPPQRGYTDPPPPPRYDDQPHSDRGDVQKGMSFDQVQETLHRKPSRSSVRDTDYGRATIEDYFMGDTVLTVTYINGVVTKVSRADR